MNLVVFTVLIGLFRILVAATGVMGESAWLQLENALGIGDISTLGAIQEVMRAPFDTGAQKACGIANLLFDTEVQPVNHSSAIPGYIGQQSALYPNRTQAYWSDNCWQKSSCIVSPRSTAQVAQIMAVIRLTQTSFSVRSGGHDFNLNHSSVDQNGILVDMANFNAISLHDDKRGVTVGAGTRWGAVYNALNGTGMSVNGARSPNPAVGGQTLGGGIGWLTHLVGVTAASVKAAEVVLANSSIVQATDTTNPDLLWALRGGGPNYGIVTSFTYKTLQIDKMWFSARRYTSDKNRQLLDALVEYQRLAANDTKANIVYQLSEDKTAAQSFVGFLYLDPNADYPSVFSPFYGIAQAEDMINATVGTLADLTSHYNTAQYPDPGVPPSRYL